MISHYDKRVAHGAMRALHKGEGSVDESTIKCSVDKIDSSPSKDAYYRSAICMKEVKDLNVARDSPDVSSNGLLNTIQTFEMPIEQIKVRFVRSTANPGTWEIAAMKCRTEVTCINHIISNM